MGIPKVRVEEEHQRALWQWVQTQPWRDHWFHVGNERANKLERMILSGLGVKPGVLDNWLMLPRGGYFGMVSELKRPRPGARKPTDTQLAWLERLNASGYYGVVDYGIDEAMESLLWYTSQMPTIPYIVEQPPAVIDRRG